MTIASEVTKLNTNLTNSYTAVSGKGGTLPQAQNFDNLATAISSIPSGGGSSEKYGATVDTLLGNVDANGVYQYPSPNGSIDLVFTGVKKIGIGPYSGAALHYAFYDNPCIKSASFPDLEDIVKVNALNYCFWNCSYMTTVSFPKLKTISSSNAMSYAFSSTNIEEINFEALETITGGNAFRYCLQGYAVASISKLKKCYFPKLSNVNATSIFSSCFAQQVNLTDVYFNSLTTTSFGSYSNQFQGMFTPNTGSSASNGCTAHFPSNLQSKVSTLSGYPTFGGNSSYIHLAFDLSATS